MSAIRFGLSRHAPEIDEEEAVKFAADKGLPDVLLLKFHSDIPLMGLEERGIGWMERNRYAYVTVRWGNVYGWTYAIPCKKTDGRDSAGRTVYIDEKGNRFSLEWHDGSPECPCRAYLRNV